MDLGMKKRKVFDTESNERFSIGTVKQHVIILSIAVSPLFLSTNKSVPEKWVPDQSDRFLPARRVPRWPVGIRIPGGYSETWLVGGEPAGSNQRR